MHEIKPSRLSSDKLANASYFAIRLNLQYLQWVNAMVGQLGDGRLVDSGEGLAGWHWIFMISKLWMPLSQINFLQSYWNSLIALRNLIASSNSSFEGLMLSATVMTFCILLDLSVTILTKSSIQISFF